MLEKFIVHIKNIIFLKLIIYLLVIGILLWMMPIMREDYHYAVERKEQAGKAYSEAAVKLYSILESENKILDTYRMYESISNTPAEYLCILRKKIFDKLKSLALKYKLDQPFIEFTQIFKPGEGNNSSEIKIKSYNVNTSFTSNDVTTFQNIIQQIYTAMPENSIVTLAQIEFKEYLDPAIISELTTSSQPNFLTAKFNLIIRELSVK